MEEKLLKGRKCGLAVVILVIAAYIAAFALMFYGFVNGYGEGDTVLSMPHAVLAIVCLILLMLLWIPLLGLKILRPQEAYVLTLLRLRARAFTS